MSENETIQAATDTPPTEAVTVKPKPKKRTTKPKAKKTAAAVLVDLVLRKQGVTHHEACKALKPARL
jgi:hypothetical protein